MLPYHRRLLECVLLYIGLPLLLFFFHSRTLMIELAWGGALLAWLVLRRAHAWRFRADWNASALRGPWLRAVLLRFVFCAALLALFAWAVEPALLFFFVRTRPLSWALVMLLYPLLSVIPQEILFRAFFLSRYGPLFLTPRAAMIASAAAFSFAHLVFFNWVAISFTFVGGLMFAGTYTRSRSLALACLEHALYGCWIFTLGWYFYGVAWNR